MAKKDVVTNESKGADYDDIGLIAVNSSDIKEDTTNIPFLEDVLGEEKPSKKEEPKYIKRGNKKLYKTNSRYVYKTEEGYYVYRLYLKESKTDRFYSEDPETHKPLKTESDAAVALNLHKRIINNDPTIINEKMTFEQVWKHFLSTEHERAKETIRRYSSIYDIHVSYTFGNRPIKEIKTFEYSEFLKKIYRHGTARPVKKDNDSKERLTENEKRRKKVTNGYSLAYVESMLKFLYLVLHHAASIKVITYEDYYDFRENCKLPKKQKKKDKKEIRVLTQKQIVEIKNLLNGTDFYLPFLISLLTGTRPAETFALQFSDFDFDNKTVTINKQIVDEDGMMIIKNPKTETSTRTIEISDYLIAAVIERKKHIEELRTRNPNMFEANQGKVLDARDINEKLIPMPFDMISRDNKGRYVTAHSFSYYTKIIKKNICPNNDEHEDFSFYTFRKTHLSNMAATNCPIGELMKRAGHSKIERLYKNYYNTNETATQKLLSSLAEMDKIVK